MPGEDLPRDSAERLNMNPWSENPLQQGLDNMWDNRIWVHILYRIMTAFHIPMNFFCHPRQFCGY